jgi:hypothetical protein
MIGRVTLLGWTGDTDTSVQLMDAKGRDRAPEPDGKERIEGSNVRENGGGQCIRVQFAVRDQDDENRFKTVCRTMVLGWSSQIDQ